VLLGRVIASPWGNQMARNWTLIVVIALSHLAVAQAQDLSAEEAWEHIDEQATVCGVVVSSRYASKSKGKPTFRNADRPYPDHIFHHRDLE
jgi:hypothetical protein